MKKVLPLLACGLLFAGCPRRGAPLAAGERDAAQERISAYRAYALEPARIPPPTVSRTEREVHDGPIVGHARIVRPEEADWNQWVDGGPRLFNNRVALLFQLEIGGPGPISWNPDDTRLEVNDERMVLPVAPSAEILLAELLFHAYLEEQWALDGDLVNRTRGAGPFRSTYLPSIDLDDDLDGVIAFPLAVGETLLYDLHVVALRLTVPIVAEDGTHDLVWVFD